MPNYTVVIKVNNNNGAEWPYDVRADTEEEAIDKAQMRHFSKRDSKTSENLQVSVVEWYDMY